MSMAMLAGEVPYPTIDDCVLALMLLWLLVLALLLGVLGMSMEEMQIQFRELRFCRQLARCYDLLLVRSSSLVI